MTTDERLEKAVEEFKKLRAEVKELKKSNEELDRKFEFIKAQLAKKHKDMIDIYKWYLERLVVQTDRLEASNDIKESERPIKK